MLVRNYQTTGRHVAKHNHHVSADTNLRGETLRSLVYCQNGIQVTHNTFQTKLKELAGNYISYFTSHTNLSLRTIDFVCSYNCARGAE